MGIKKLTIKDWVILILGLGLLVSLYINHKSGINYHDNEINKLHKANNELILKNDSLNKVNAKLDEEIAKLDTLIIKTQEELLKKKSELQTLKNKKNEVYNHISRMSANNISIEMSNYLNSRTKGKNNH